MRIPFGGYTFKVLSLAGRAYNLRKERAKERVPLAGEFFCHEVRSSLRGCSCCMPPDAAVIGSCCCPGERSRHTRRSRNTVNSKQQPGSGGRRFELGTHGRAPSTLLLAGNRR